MQLKRRVAITRIIGKFSTKFLLIIIIIFLAFWRNSVPTSSMSVHVRADTMTGGTCSCSRWQNLLIVIFMGCPKWWTICEICSINLLRPVGISSVISGPNTCNTISASCQSSLPFGNQPATRPHPPTDSLCFASTFAAVCPISWLRPHANYKCHSNCNKFEYTLRLQQISRRCENVCSLLILYFYIFLFLLFIYLFFVSFFWLPTMPRAGCDTHLPQNLPHKVANAENCQRCISISFALTWKLFIRKGQTEVCNLLRWRLD